MFLQNNLEIDHYMQLEELYKYLDTKFKNPDETLHIQLMAAGGTVNSDKSIDDLDCNYMYDADFDEESCNIELNMELSKAKLKPIEVEYLQWEDNLSEMKMFCKNECKITYEYASGIDCYWNLQVMNIDYSWTTVPLHSYVVKFPDRFIVMDEVEFKEYIDL